MTTATYWHIADESYCDGDALYCRNIQGFHGVTTAWKWGDDAAEGFDSDMVCLFPDTPNGRQEADWLWYEHRASVLLRVSIDDDYYTVTQVEEGYPAVVGQIDAADITIARRGYADGMISEAGVS